MVDRRRAARESTHLHLEAPALALARQHICEALAHELDDLGLVLEADLLLGRVHVGVDLGRVELEAQVDERVRALGEEVRVEGLEGALERRAVDEAVCEEGKPSVSLEVGGTERGPRGEGSSSLLMKNK